MIFVLAGACSFNGAPVGDGDGDGGGQPDAASDAPDSLCGEIFSARLDLTQLPALGDAIRLQGTDWILDTDPVTPVLRGGDGSNIPVSGVVVAVVGTPGVFVIHAESVELEASRTLRLIGERAVAIVANERIEIAGTIDASSDAGGTVGAGSDPVCLGREAGDGGESGNFGGGGGGGGFGLAGGRGGRSDGESNTRGPAGDPILTTPVDVVGGCSGANGGDGTNGGVGGGLGSPGGGAIELVARCSIAISGGIDVGGAGGGGGRLTRGGGGGGGAGGFIGVESLNVVVTAAAMIAANGGGGGEGRNSAGSDPGDDGGLGAAPADGGDDPGSGNGGDGGALDAPAQDGQDNSSTAGGGGGGGAGFIVINSDNATVEATTSPMHVVLPR